MAVRPQKLTYDDLVAFPDDGLRRELINGEAFVTPAPNTRHQDIVGRLFRAIGNYLEAHGGGQVFVAPYDVVLRKDNVVEPDLVFVADDRGGIVTPENIQGAPSLVIEVLSDPHRDRHLKRALYARVRIPEYWIVDPDADRVEVYRLPRGKRVYPDPEVLAPGKALTTPLIPGFSINLAELLRR